MAAKAMQALQKYAGAFSNKQPSSCSPDNINFVIEQGNQLLALDTNSVPSEKLLKILEFCANKILFDLQSVSQFDASTLQLVNLVPKFCVKAGSTDTKILLFWFVHVEKCIKSLSVQTTAARMSEVIQNLGSDKNRAKFSKPWITLSSGLIIGLTNSLPAESRNCLDSKLLRIFTTFPEDVFRKESSLEFLHFVYSILKEENTTEFEHFELLALFLYVRSAIAKCVIVPVLEVLTLSTKCLKLFVQKLLQFQDHLKPVSNVYQNFTLSFHSAVIKVCPQCDSDTEVVCELFEELFENIAPMSALFGKTNENSYSTKLYAQLYSVLLSSIKGVPESCSEIKILIPLALNVFTKLYSANDPKYDLKDHLKYLASLCRNDELFPVLVRIYAFFKEVLSSFSAEQILEKLPSLVSIWVYLQKMSNFQLDITQLSVADNSHAEFIFQCFSEQLNLMTVSENTLINAKQFIGQVTSCSLSADLKFELLAQIFRYLLVQTDRTGFEELRGYVFAMKTKVSSVKRPFVLMIMGILDFVSTLCERSFSVSEKAVLENHLDLILEGMKQILEFRQSVLSGFPPIFKRILLDAACVFEATGFKLNALQIWVLLARTWKDCPFYVLFYGYLCSLNCGSISLSSKFSQLVIEHQNDSADKNLDFFQEVVRLRNCCIHKRESLVSILPQVVNILDISVSTVTTGLKTALVLDLLSDVLAESGHEESFYIKWKCEAFKIWTCLAKSIDKLSEKPKILSLFISDRGYMCGLLVVSMLFRSYTELSFMCKSSGLIDVSTRYDCHIYESISLKNLLCYHVVHRALVEYAFCFSLTDDLELSRSFTVDLCNFIQGIESNLGKTAMSSDKVLEPGEEGEDVKKVNVLPEINSEFLHRIKFHEFQCLCSKCGNIDTLENLILSCILVNQQQPCNNRLHVLQYNNLLNSKMSHHIDALVAEFSCNNKSAVDCGENYVPFYSCVGSFSGVNKSHMFNYTRTKLTTEAATDIICEQSDDNDTKENTPNHDSLDSLVGKLKSASITDVSPNKKRKLSTSEQNSTSHPNSRVLENNLRIEHSSEEKEPIHLAITEELLQVSRCYRDYSSIRKLCNRMKDLSGSDIMKAQCYSYSINPSISSYFMFARCQTEEKSSILKKSKWKTELKFDLSFLPPSWAVVQIMNQCEGSTPVVISKKSKPFSLAYLPSMKDVFSNFNSTLVSANVYPSQRTKKDYWNHRWMFEEKLGRIISVLDSKTGNVNKLLGVKTKVVILILGSDCMSIPWEVLKCFKNRQVGRYPSLHFFTQHFRLISEFCTRKVSASNSCYLLNPSGNLKKTQDRLQEFLESELKWGGITGREPSKEEMKTCLESCDLFLYCGHGAGSSFYPHSYLREVIRTKCVPLLMGCSSGALRVSGDLDPSGVAYNFLISGCPAVVANLWKVSDAEIDLFTITLLREMCCKGSAGERGDVIGKDTLSSLVNSARDAVKLPITTGAAPVIYGLPSLQFI